MRIEVNRIVPRHTEPGPDALDRLRAEYRQHLARAQELYEKALEAHMTGASNRDLLFRQTIMEQNAALLCQGELLMLAHEVGGGSLPRAAGGELR